jgi:hypothetical protein
MLLRPSVQKLHAALSTARGAHFTRAARPQAAGPVSAFNVVILYEQLAYVGKAMATYLHLMRELADDFAPDFRLWRLDAALAPASAAEAERDIATAEVIIVAVSGGEPCPPAFQRWKSGAGHGGGPPPRAIIALMAASPQPVPAEGSWSNVLCGAGTQIHSEVFVCHPPVSAAMPLPAA